MNPVAFKIENLIPASFGGVGLPFPGIPRDDKGIAIPGFNAIETNGRKWPNSGDLTIEHVKGIKYYLPVGFRVDGELLQLPLEPMMTLDFKKTIVKTSMAGSTRRGTVKELINDDDITITLQGICYDHTHNGYPEDQVRILKRIWEHKGSIQIISMLTELLEIKYVVVESHLLPGVTGHPFSQPYSFSLISDEDFILVY